VNDDDKVIQFPARDTPPAPEPTETPLEVLRDAILRARPLAAPEWLQGEIDVARPRLIAAVRNVIAERDRQWRAALEEADPVVAKKVLLHLPGRPS
jgi:hypothetical protein